MWFVAQSILGIALAVVVIEGLRQYPFLRDALGGVSPDLTVASGVLGTGIVLLLALLVFASLLELRPWARLVLLIVGWLTVVSAAFGLLTTPAALAWFAPDAARTGLDATLLGAVNVLTKAMDVAYWGWVIAVLQFNRAVCAAFAAPEHTPATP
jgi:hypothetical protein